MICHKKNTGKIKYPASLHPARHFARAREMSADLIKNVFGSDSDDSDSDDDKAAEKVTATAGAAEEKEDDDEGAKGGGSGDGEDSDDSDDDGAKRKKKKKKKRRTTLEDSEDEDDGEDEEARDAAPAKFRSSLEDPDLVDDDDEDADDDRNGKRRAVPTGECGITVVVRKKVSPHANFAKVFLILRAREKKKKASSVVSIDVCHHPRPTAITPREKPNHSARLLYPCTHTPPARAARSRPSSVRPFRFAALLYRELRRRGADTPWTV